MLISILASTTCRQLSNSALSHVLSPLASAITGTGTINNFKNQCATFLLEAGSALSGLASSSSDGQVLASALAIHPVELSDLKQHVAWGGGTQQLQSLHRLWKKSTLVLSMSLTFLHIFSFAACLFLAPLSPVLTVLFSHLLFWHKLTAVL